MAQDETILRHLASSGHAHMLDFEGDKRAKN